LSSSRRKALVIAAGMGAAAVLAQLLKPRSAASALRLEQLFPASVGPWQLDEQADVFVRPSDDRGRVYGVYDQVLERVYAGPGGARIMLSVAYGNAQSTGLQMHRPEICYAGGGFQVRDMHQATLQSAGRALPVTRLHAAKPGRSEPITYWTVLGGEVVKDGAGFRWRRLSSSLRGQLLDGMLVRISSIDPEPQRAYAMHEHFAQALLAAIEPGRQVHVAGPLPPA
jgi:EpsI family protein